jgi:histidinol-phosphate aminotransferase
VQCFQPSYSLYPVLAAAHGAKTNRVELNGDFSLPPLSALRSRGWDFKAALSLITTPNAPSGQGFSTAALDQLCLKQKGIVLLDEAYVDFAKENALELALKHPHVLVARTFSKAYSLCFQRVGYFVGSVELINALQKIRDSYNVNGLGQVAAVATLSDLNYYRENFKRIIASRENISRSLEELGFETTPSQTNFVFTRPPGFAARLWLEKLRENKILVRWFDQEKINDYLRITIGSESEMDYFLKTVHRLRK